MSITAIVKALVTAGASPEQIAAAVEAAEASAIAAKEERRAKERDKKRRQRMSRDVPGTSGDSGGQTGTDPSPKERSPTPPKEITPSPLSGAIAPSSEPRAGTTSEPMARLEFDTEFWPRYPHKVGKVSAIAAYIAARRKAPLAAILGGLERYKATIPDGRQWLNPATFLNQERWNDEPAAVTPRPGQERREPAHDPIFRALARQAEECDREREWQADDDVRLLDHAGREVPH